MFHMNENLVQRLNAELEEIRSAGLFKTERIIESQQGAEIIVNGKMVLNFCANNYLGLSSHPKVIEAAKKYIDHRGYGMSSVRFICGTQDIHKELEQKVAEFLGTEDTILYAAAFDANGGLFEPLFGEQDAIISDELNHASIIDGVRLCKAQRFKYKHNDMDDLAAKLKDSKNSRSRIIVTDGSFSMDGTIAKLDTICDLADQYDAIVMTDESHSSGSSIAVLELLSETTTIRDKLEYNTKYFRSKMTEAGFDIKPGDHPIVPIMLYDAVVAQNFAARLLEESIYVIGFFYPVVAKGLARIRVQLSAAHEQHHLDKAITAFSKIGKELGVVK
jgi:7-keto-8-aminopelargonate synthetase-like enzyme